MHHAALRVQCTAVSIYGMSSADALQSAWAGIPVCFGSDLLGEMRKHQSQEFSICGRVQSPADVLRSATVNCASLFGMEGQIGEIAPGCFAGMLNYLLIGLCV